MSILENNSLELIQRKSSIQEERFYKAVQKDYVKIDERTLKDQLNFLLKFSKFIRYYNLNNQPEGDWSDFLIDELLVLSKISEYKPEAFESDFSSNFQKSQFFVKEEKKIKYITRATNIIYELSILIDSWFNELKIVENFTGTRLPIRDELFNMISSKLKDALGTLKLYSGLYKEALSLPAYDFSNFNSLWELKKEPSFEPLNFESFKEKFEYFSYTLKNVFQIFYENIIYLKNLSDIYFDKSLSTDTHFPHISLLVAFLRLMEVPKDNLNKIAEKYIEFYYKEILKETYKPSTFDQVYLSFKTNANVTFTNINENALFVGGKGDQGENILYKADEQLQVNKAEIMQLNTVFADISFISVRGYPKKLISNVLYKNIPLKDITPSETLKDKKGYSAFGENQSDRSLDERTMENAEVGFALSSYNLLLSEGLRGIAVDFFFTQESFGSLVEYLSFVQYGTEDAEEEVFVKAFVEAFVIYITTTKGWLKVDRYVVTRKAEKFQLTVKFDLLEHEPSVIAFNPLLHQGNYAIDQPVLKIVLNNNSYIYPFSLMNKLVLERIQIEVDVKNVKNLKLYNETGTLSAEAPFYPFGTNPALGSYFIIGKNEIFYKSLEHLQVNIKWFNLPKNPNGFMGYYQEYNSDIDNASFQARFSSLIGGRWLPNEDSKDAMVYQLFKTKPSEIGVKSDTETVANASLQSDVNFKIETSRIKQQANYTDINSETNYSNLVSRGFVKLELINPPVAFGHSIFPAILSEVLMDNAKSGIMSGLRNKLVANQPKRNQPNQPYTPQIETISLDYKSSETILLDSRAKKNTNTENTGCFFHIHPFGEHKIYPNAYYLTTNLLPVIDYEGALLIGFDKLDLPQYVSILVEISESYTVSSEEEPPALEWSYLADDQWQLLPASKVLQDGTNRFLKTGVIVLELPRGMKKDNTILNKNYYWLRISALQNAERAGKITTITTQVLKATLVDDSVKKDHLNQPLSAFSIKRSYSELEGIRSIIQPLESFGGIPTETKEKFYTRIAESLKHKGKAITPWDYERIILEKFPDLQSVTCLPNMTSRSLSTAGNVLIVVIPYPDKKSENQLEPRANSELLYEIKKYIGTFTSSFVKIEVRNPAYERIRILCKVKFKDGFSYGFYSQKLNDEINNYLAGSLVESRKSGQLGGRMNISDITSFIRTLNYVDFITEFSMIQVAQDFRGRFVLIDTSREGDEKPYLQATKPWSVLVPMAEHQIKLIDDKEEIRAKQAGIDDLELGSDLIIN
ncbi:hypothetical protein AD998_08480 [bacterium 336/3]|nr:hypothetical protein AD998_08480 [bacterium 336/3]